MLSREDARGSAFPLSYFLIWFLLSPHSSASTHCFSRFRSRIFFNRSGNLLAIVPPSFYFVFPSQCISPLKGKGGGGPCRICNCSIVCFHNRRTNAHRLYMDAPYAATSMASHFQLNDIISISLSLLDLSMLFQHSTLVSAFLPKPLCKGFRPRSPILSLSVSFLYA